MQNTFFCEDDLTVDLLEAMETGSNTIFVDFTADSTPSQELVVTRAEISVTIAVTSSAHNHIQIPATSWATGGTTTITLNKNGTPAKTISITFPLEIDTDAACFPAEDAIGQDYEVQGSWNYEEDVRELVEGFSNLDENALRLLTASSIDTSDIADWSNNNAIYYFFNALEDIAESVINFSIGATITTTVSSDTYHDCEITITITMDDTQLSQATDTYADGDRIISYSQTVTNITQGVHLITVNLEANGGAIT